MSYSFFWEARKIIADCYVNVDRGSGTSEYHTRRRETPIFFLFYLFLLFLEFFCLSVSFSSYYTIIMMPGRAWRARCVGARAIQRGPSARRLLPLPPPPEGRWRYTILCTMYNVQCTVLRTVSLLLLLLLLVVVTVSVLIVICRVSIIGIVLRATCYVPCTITCFRAPPPPGRPLALASKEQVRPTINK